MPEMPEWVHVWGYLRYGRSPAVHRSLPGQQLYDSMPDSEYAQYRAEWVLAGSPQISSTAILRALAGDVLAVEAAQRDPMHEPVPF